MTTEVETPVRSVPMEITIKAGDDTSVIRKFLLYPGTEIVYVQGVDVAVCAALSEISKAAYGILVGAEGVPANVALEASFGKAVQSVQSA